MNAIATFMQNQTAVITVGVIGTLFGFVGVVVLGAFSFVSAFVYRVPGGVLCVLGYARLTLHVLRGRNS